jgi:hypothetical protein
VKLATPNLGIAIDWLWSILCQNFDGVAVEDADDMAGEIGGEYGRSQTEMKAKPNHNR